jgi:outer membrane protein OmpA-like peptidoglycan-associated protein
MPTSSSSAAAAAAARRRWRLAAAAATALLGACSALPPQPAERPAEAQLLDDAVASLTTTLLARAQIDPAEKRVLVVDPMIDRASGNQTAVTRAMEPRVVRTVSQQYPRIEAMPFTLASLDRQPVVLVGCTTPVAAPGTAMPPTGGQAYAYRLWASLADLRTGKFVSREAVAWVRPEDVDMSPTLFFRDSPVWTLSGGMGAHLQACAGDLGDTVSPAYLNSIRASAAMNDAITAYENGRYPDALALYTQASQLPGGDQARVWNGIYLSNVAMSRPREAEDAFGRMVDLALTNGFLSVKFVFRPYSVEFWSDKAVSGQYPVWLRQIAQRSSARSTCLLLIGHTSPTGPPAANDALSERRAEYVRNRLVQRAPSLRTRTEAQGRGARDLIVGTGKDDWTDLLDRRVEFEPHPCGGLESDPLPGRT